MYQSVNLKSVKNFLIKVLDYNRKGKSMITSKDNEIIKEIKKLKEKKFRKDKFIVEGIKMVKEAINEKASIDKIVFCNLELENEIENLNNYKFVEVSGKVFKELTDVVTPQGVLAVINKRNDNKKIDTTSDYLLALDNLQDPGNLGTIIRTADAANLKQIIVSKDTVDAYSPKVIRSTMGAIYRVNIIEVENLKETLFNLKKDNFEIVTTSLQTNNSIYDIKYKNKVVVIGNEANGVEKEIQEMSDYKVKIPMLGKTESLNASVAASIMIYEYVRQKI